ncbi:MAG TPA: hypothetical protein VGL62_07630 [Vicinamibacterales bacterium]|jgi:uncharacterized protein HemX
MTARRWLSTALMGTFLVGLTPATTWAAGPDQPNRQTPDLRSAITRAAASAAATPSLQLQVIPARPTSDPNVRKQSTGGGHVMMVMTILGTVAGIGATVYMVKQMQKTEKSITTPNQ